MSYTFNEVRAALRSYWGLGLMRGNASNGVHGKDGRWDVSHARTGFVVSGQFPGTGYKHVWYRSLVEIVRNCDLKKVIDRQRRVVRKEVV